MVCKKASTSLITKSARHGKRRMRRVHKNWPEYSSSLPELLIRHSVFLSFRFLGRTWSKNKLPKETFSCVSSVAVASSSRLVRAAFPLSSFFKSFHSCLDVQNFSFERKHSYKKQHRHPNCTAKFSSSTRKYRYFSFTSWRELSQLHREGSQWTTPSQELIFAMFYYL